MSESKNFTFHIIMSLLYYDVPYFHTYIYTHLSTSCTHTHTPLLKVRYAVVLVLKEVYSRLGNAFMPLLPETIPFLAELLEGV